MIGSAASALILDFGGVISKTLFETHLAIEANYRNAMRDVPDDRFQHRIQFAVVLQMHRALSTGLHNDRQSQWLPIRILIQPNFLGHTVIGHFEIIRVQRKYVFPLLRLHDGGHED